MPQNGADFGINHGDFSVSVTDCYRTTDAGQPIAAMKSYLMSPFVEYEHVDQLLQAIIDAQRIVDRSDESD